MEFGLFHLWGPLKGDSDLEADNLIYREAHHPDAYDANFQQAEAAETMGWDHVWLASGQFVSDQNINPSPFIVAAALARSTSRIKIGTAVHLPGVKAPGEQVPASVKREDHRYAFEHLLPADPLQTAAQVAMVDQISQGRFIYGVGGKTVGDELRRELFFEYLEVMKKAWTDEHFSGFQGKHYNYPPFHERTVSITPKPYQKPHPPILVPVDSQQSFEPMGAMGYQIAIGGGTSHNQRGSAVLKQDVENYRRAWRNAGHPGNPTVAIRIPTLVAETREKLARDRDALLDVGRERISRGAASAFAFSTDGTASLTTTEEDNLFGTPEEVVDRIHELREEFGADSIMFEVNWVNGVPHETVLRTMQLITEKVIPQFK